MSGCFSGEYTRRMKETMEHVEEKTRRAQAVFGQASEVVDASGTSTGISLRMPVFVDDNAKSLVAGEPNAQPPFVDLPGFAYAYEIPLDETPAYVYLAAVEAADVETADELARDVQTTVGQTFSDAAWEEAAVEGFSGGTKQFKRLRVVGPQEFGTTKTEGQFDLYLVSASNYHVLIGWRASLETDQAHGFFEKVAIAMGTVQGAS
ncbi:MAG: hypothetical protein ACQESR_19820 [Planctomycetota bacterium]